jgi:hypothetical protein
VDRLDECLADWNDSENISVSERWESLKNIITTTSTADSVLEKVDKGKCEDWFDAECEHVTTLKIGRVKEHNKGTKHEILWKSIA